MNAYDVLVIILSITLGVFLILSIVLVSIFIGMAKKVNRIVGNIEEATENLKEMAENFKGFAIPAAVIKSILSLINATKRRSR
jgi:hypothetical protein